TVHTSIASGKAAVWQRCRWKGDGHGRPALRGSGTGGRVAGPVGRRLRRRRPAAADRGRPVLRRERLPPPQAPPHPPPPGARAPPAAGGWRAGACYAPFAWKAHVFLEMGGARQKSVLAVGSEPPATGDPAAYLKSLVARFVAWHARYHVAGRVGQYELSGLT